MTLRPLRRDRYCAFYIELPFALSPTVAVGERNLVVPPLPGSSSDDDATVRLRFHTARSAAPQVRTAALDVALRNARLGPLENARLAAVGEQVRKRVDVAPPESVRIVELVTQRPDGVITPEISEQLMRRCLAALNRFLGLYLVSTEDPKVHAIKLEHLPAEVVLGLRAKRRGPNRRLRFPNIEAPLDGETVPPAADHLLSLIERGMRSESRPHPIDLVRKLRVDAVRLSDSGEYDAAVLTLQTSAERLLYALFDLALIDDGKTRAEVEAARPDVFRTLVASLGQQVGGNWSMAGAGPVAIYWERLYMARNRLAHAGMAVTLEQLDQAFVAYDGLWAHCLASALKARARRPNTALALHGGIGLRSAGGLDSRMKRHIEELERAGHELQFWLPQDERL